MNLRQFILLIGSIFIPIKRALGDRLSYDEWLKKRMEGQLLWQAARTYHAKYPDEFTYDEAVFVIDQLRGEQSKLRGDYPEYFERTSNRLKSELRTMVKNPSA